MRCSVLLAVTAAAVVGLTAACGSDESPTIDAGGGSTTTTAASGSSSTTASTTTTTSTTAAGSTEVQEAALTLTGDAVVPGPGSDGSAEATLTYDGDELCLSGVTTGVGAVVGGHVHAGPAGESGPVVVDLGIATEGDGPFDGCAMVGAEGGVVLVDPASYYVQLHTAALPDGAVRAQIG